MKSFWGPRPPDVKRQVAPYLFGVPSALEAWPVRDSTTQVWSVRVPPKSYSPTMETTPHPTRSAFSTGCPEALSRRQGGP